MLASLHVQNFVLIDDLTIDFSEHGFHTFTGETGAGKSLLVDALGLLLGNRAQKEVVRHGEKEAVVEATFDLRALPEVKAQCESSGYVVEDDVLVVRRVLSADGRSKVFVGGRMSAIGEMQRITAQLVAICGQNTQYELAAPDAALDALDRYARTESLRGKFAESFHAHRAAVAQRDALSLAEKQRLARLDYVAFQLQELEEVAPAPGEEAHLREARNRLAFAEKLHSGLMSGVDLLSGDEGNAAGRVAGARKLVRDLCKIDPSLDATASRLDALQVEIGDLARSLERYVGALSHDPAELDRLEARLAMLSRLAKKHGCTVEELSAHARSLTAERDALSSADAKRAELDAEIARLEETLTALGSELTRARRKAAQKVGAEVTRALRPLALPNAEFTLHMETVGTLGGASAKGFDRVRYELTTNPGEPARPLARVASGGELSRVSLALEAVLGDRSDVPTFIFDEIDAGIGGAVAEVVGQTLEALGRRRQVLCVTHAAQIAALAGRHFQVEKHTVAGRTVSRVGELLAGARKEELARMLGGVQITDTVRKHAAELLRGFRAGEATEARA